MITSRIAGAVASAKIVQGSTIIMCLRSSILWRSFVISGGSEGLKTYWGADVAGAAATWAQDLAPSAGAGGEDAALVSDSVALAIDAVREVHCLAVWVIFIMASAWARVVASRNLRASANLSEKEETKASVSDCMEEVNFVSM